MKYTIICPLCEDGELLSITLDSLFRLNCENYEIIFAADPAASAAIIITQAICDRYPSIPNRIIVDAAIYCINPKLNNVYKAWLVASGESILMTDCNMLLPPDAIERLEARWDDATGMVCSPPIGSQPQTFAAEIECAFLNTFQAKWQILADRSGNGFAQGKVMFCRKSQFEQIGGLLQLDDEPCEDAAATKLVRRAGLHIRLVRRLFKQPLGKRSFQQVWNRQLRWAKLRRVSFPAWYAAELMVTPLPLLITLSLSSHRLIPILIVAACYTGELLIAKCAGWHLSWKSPFVFFARDVMFAGVWIAGWFGHDFRWAGHALALHPKMTEQPPISSEEELSSS